MALEMIDLICPTIAGREASLERCLESFRATGADLNEIIVEESETCGGGWKAGLKRSEAPYVALICDDQECAGAGWAEVCMETVEEGLIPCPRVWTPDGAIESNGGDMNAPHHLIRRPLRDRAPVDYTTVPFLSREMVEAIGMLDVHYSSDVWVSYRGRQLGYETVLRHGFEIVHHQEQVGRGAGMGQAERDALDEKTMRKELSKCAS